MLCFLCEKSGRVKRFSEDRLQKCRKILAFRKKKVLMYNNIKLPKSLSLNGYHIECYNRFIVLRNQNRKEFELFVNTVKQKPIISSVVSLKTQNRESAEPNANEKEMNTPAKIEMSIKTEEYLDCAMKIEPDIKTETEQTNAKDVSIPELEFPLASCGTKTEPSYIFPNISNGMILKSILLRKSPVKSDNTAMESGSHDPDMVLLLPKNPTSNQTVESKSEALDATLMPKILNTTSLAATGVCTFCDKKERSVGTQREFPIKSNQNLYKKVLTFAEHLNDNVLLEKLRETKAFEFHPLCRTEYRNKREKLTRKNCDNQDKLVFKKLHAEAFEALCVFIGDKIIDNRKTYFLSDLYERYKVLLCEIQNSPTPLVFERYILQNLDEKIVNRYNGAVHVTNSEVFKKRVVHRSDMTTNLNSAMAEHEHLKYDSLAFELRELVKNLNRTSGSKNAVIPDQLYNFIGSLIQGPDLMSMNSDHSATRKMCQDIVDKIMKA